MSELTLATTAIDGLVVLTLPVHGDRRGWFKENWQREKFLGLGLPDFGPVQHNISFNASAGTTRGIHAEPWDKLVSVATGAVFGAWVDLRPGPGFGTVVTARIDPGTAVFVPRGVGNAFQTLEDDTAYTYLVNDHWSPDAAYTFLNLADPTAAVDWPIPLDDPSVTMSDKDRAHPLLPEVEPLAPRPILVLGAGGQVGRALAALAEASGRSDLEFADRARCDIADPAAVDALPLRRYRAVINAAAHTQVDQAETEAAAAWATNAAGPARLAARCAEAGIPLLHFSTDYVFDGTVREHREDEPLSPLGVYGQSKAAGDLAVTAHPRHYLLRTTWVVGEGKNFVTTMLRLADSGVDPAVVDDQHGRLTFADDLAAAALHLLDAQAPYGTYNVTNAGPVMSWFEIAQEVFRLAGADPQRVRPVSTADYTATAGSGPVAPRPAHSALDLSRIRAAGFTPPEAPARLAEYVQRHR